MCAAITSSFRFVSTTLTTYLSFECFFRDTQEETVNDMQESLCFLVFLRSFYISTEKGKKDCDGNYRER